MGSDKLSGVLFGAWNPQIGEETPEKEASLERSVNSMREVIETAEELDVYCNLEVTNRFEQFLINTSEEALDYIERVGSPNLKLHLDTFHMNIEEDDMRETILKAGDQLGYFHVEENNRRPPGWGGHIDWGAIAEGLEQIDYEEEIVIESFVIPKGNVSKSVSLWRDLREDKNLDDEAKKSLKFLKAKLE